MKTSTFSINDLKQTLQANEILTNTFEIKGGNGDENPDRALRLTPRQLRDRMNQMNLNQNLFGKNMRSVRP
jgi:hypothetical protein